MTCCFQLKGSENKRKNVTVNKEKTPFGAKLMIYVEARAGVEPTYTDLQSGA